MNEQDVLNIAAEGVIRQGCKSMLDQEDWEGDGKMICAYRGEDGKRCAIGHVIPDELYDVELESLGADDILDFPKIGDLFAGCSHIFLQGLQNAHDYCGGVEGDEFRRSFARRIADLAADFGLMVPEACKPYID